MAIKIPSCPRKITLASHLWAHKKRGTEGSCDGEEPYLGALGEKIK